jgi:hypothetical protein
VTLESPEARRDEVLYLSQSFAAFANECTTLPLNENAGSMKQADSVVHLRSL